MERDIEAVNRAQAIALLSDGTTLPVTNWFDSWGDECEPQEAVSCVAGQEGSDWWSIDLSQFASTPTH